MIQEQKELLLKDICSRLPHRVKCEVIKRRIDGEMVYIRNGSVALELTINNFKELVTDNLYDIKPYLFPLSSMTKEQRKELFYLSGIDIICGKFYTNSEFTLEETLSGINWLLKNHFDINGLIPMDLAIDATGLNIY